MEKYVMALDQGTTSSRCILFDKMGDVAGIAQKEHAQIYPSPGWVEHDPLEIWNNQLEAAQTTMRQAGIGFEQVATVGITNQRETTVVWDRATGVPVCNAIVWQCRRTTPLCDELSKRGLSGFFKKRTGLTLDPYFSGTKLRWILDNIPGVREKAEEGKLAFGTIDTWLIWNMTGGKVHATDYSNASRTMLFNINDLSWDKDILKELDIPVSLLPAVHPSSFLYGETDLHIFGGQLPITGVLGDQQAALYGHGCHVSGMAKNTYGTGGFLLMNTGDKPVFSEKGLLTTLAWCIDGQITYALEGSVFVAGAAIQWLRDGLNIIEDSKDSERMARSVKDNNGVYFVPAFVGMGAPYWNPHARGTVTGLTRGSDRNHLVRAALEAIAYQTEDVLSLMEEESGIKLLLLKVDGGASNNDFLMQFQTDIIKIPVNRPDVKEITAWGTALLAGTYCGFFPGDIDPRCGRVFSPEMNENSRLNLLKGWKRAVSAALFWSEYGEI